MSEVLGVGLLLVGFTIGYLVLAGKLPSSQPIVKAPGGSGPTVPTPAVQPPLGSMGLPTMVHLSDQAASQGAYQ